VSLSFGSIYRESLLWLYLKEGVTAAFEVGQYWSKATQIDGVGLRDDGWTDLGECKWGTVRSPKAAEQELEEKVQEFPNTRGATIGRRVAWSGHEAGPVFSSPNACMDGGSVQTRCPLVPLKTRPQAHPGPGRPPVNRCTQAPLPARHRERRFPWRTEASRP
jgi:hypothetical protein